VELPGVDEGVGVSAMAADVQSATMRQTDAKFRMTAVPPRNEPFESAGLDANFPV
jgi:hypothetical protein